MSILEGELADAMSAALNDAGVPYAVTVARTTTAPPNPATPHIPGSPTTANHACRGWVDAWTQDERADATITEHDVKVIILLAGLAIVPRSGDDVTVHGATYSVIAVQTDPAMATATLQVRS